MRSSGSWFQGIYQNIRQSRIENLGLKLLALGLATLLFAVSRQPMSDVRLERVPLEFRGIAPGLEITGEVGHTVSVRLRGPRDVVRGLMPNQVAVVADLSGKEPGDRIIQLTPSDVSMPSSIEVLRVDPATIRLNIEPSARRSVKVDPEILGKVPDDYQVTEIDINPPSVQIEGPKSQVGSIESVRTESIDLNGRTSDFSCNVSVDHANHAVRIASPALIRVSFKIAHKTPLEEAPAPTQDPRDDIQITPKKKR